MDDIDEELLGLMGAPEEEEPEPTSRKRTSPPTSVSPASKKTKTAGGKGVAKAKRRRQESDDEESDVSMEEETDEEGEEEDGEIESDHRADSESEDDEFLHPYPLEGKYKDAADKARILAMSEIEREKELAERATLIENRQQDRELRNMLRNRQKQESASRAATGAESTRRSTRAKELPHTKNATKLGQLAEIKKSRQEQGATKRGTGDSDAPKLLDILDAEAENEEERKPSVDRQVTVDDINKARMGRTAFRKLVDYPGFQKAVMNCFVRVSLFDQKARQTVYRMGKVIGLTTGKVYSIIDNGRRTDQYLKIAHGHSEKSFPMDMMSDRPFTEDEFRRYRSQLNIDKMALPTLSELQKKKRELSELDSYVLTDKEFDELIEKRKKFQINHLDLNYKRSSLAHALRTAHVKGDRSEVARLEEELADLDRTIEAQRGNPIMDEMSLINDKIRKENRIKIRNAEIAEKRARREALSNPTAGTYDPFLRVKTKVKTVFETPEDIKKREDAEKAEKEKEQPAGAAEAAKDQSPVKTTFVPSNLKGDALIASLDLGIDDDLDLGDDTLMGGDVY